MKDSSKRNIAIGCAIAALLVGIPYITIGLINLLANDLTLTQGLAKEIEEAGHVRNEFDRDNDRKKILEGRVIDTHHLQFEKVLAGDERTLDVQLSREPFGPTILTEADEPTEGKPGAYLLMQLTCCMDQDAWYELFEIAEGDEKSAPEMMKRLFGYDLPEDRTEVLLVKIDFGNVFEFTTAWYRFEQRCADTWVVTGRGSSIQQQYDLDVHWHVRDKKAVTRKKLAYALTVPADVAGWPLHVLMLFALAGSVR